MPKIYKKRKRVYRKKRPMRKRKPLPLNGLEKSKLVKLRYVQTYSLDPGTGVYAQQTFRANAVYDPDSTGTGHQPANFDIFAQMYDRYTVLGSKITTVVVPTTNSVTYVPGTLIQALSEDGKMTGVVHGLGGIDGLLEQPRLSRSICQIGQLEGPTPRPLVNTFSAKKFFGTKFISGVSPYTADVSAVPAEEGFFEVAYVSSDNNNNPGIVTLRSTIDYIVLFTEPSASVLS